MVATVDIRGDGPMFGLLICICRWYHHLLYISTFHVVFATTHPCTKYVEALPFYPGAGYKYR